MLPVLQKHLSELIKGRQVFDIRLGLYGSENCSRPEQVKSLADLPDIARYARYYAGYNYGLCFTKLGPHFGRTRPFNGCGCQSLL